MKYFWRGRKYNNTCSKNEEKPCSTIRIFAPFTTSLPTSADAQAFKRWREHPHDSTLIYSRPLHFCIFYHFLASLCKITIHFLTKETKRHHRLHHPSWKSSCNPTLLQLVYNIWNWKYQIPTTMWSWRWKNYSPSLMFMLNLECFRIGHIILYMHHTLFLGDRQGGQNPPGDWCWGLVPSPWDPLKLGKFFRLMHKNAMKLKN